MMTAGSRQSFFALFHRDLRGTAAVEFALIAPVLFLLILGITQFGITLNDYEMLTGGTEAAARQFSMSRGSRRHPAVPQPLCITRHPTSRKQASHSH